jgi:predicted DNA-binding transcriptional regulator YafY
MKTMYRRMQIMSMIPRSGTITTQQIEQRLNARGIEGVSRRMIQRDLEAILTSGYFPITYEQDGQTYFWSWTEGAKILDFSTLEPHTALTFCLVNERMPTMLPKTSHRYLDPYFASSKAIMEDYQDLPISRWRDKVRCVSRHLAMTPPSFESSVVDTVYEAVLHEKRLSVTYRPRGVEHEKEYSWLNPLGLVFVEDLIYLVCTIKEYENPLQFLLHRMTSATILNEPVLIPKGFSLQGYIEGGEFGYPLGTEIIRLKALFDKESATYLRETPVPGTVTLEDYGEERVLLEADVRDSLQLRWWLKRFGDYVEVLEPAELREEFREMTENMVQMYKENSQPG